ncbi:MAG: type II toxin-antitoxin system VapC family toxin [Prosthecobacter sp.]|uniref:type II toxin-antitoxin system VapC family toxin n=1 Tax=Prosthecobacter sp. TaxID=1965333 RepID=UPI0039000754
MEVSWRYGEIYRQLKPQGTLIGGNDMWIAATALVHNLTVVTNNVDEFSRVKGLRVRTY